jgi:signal transduction histidine kinase
VVAAAAGAACVWAVDRATAEDRCVVTATGALASVLLGVAVALALSRRRLVRELRSRTEELRAQAAGRAAAHTETTRRAAGDLAEAQRALGDAEARRRTATEAQISLRAALRAETARAAALESATVQLADVTVPLAVDRLRAGGHADTVLAGLPRPTGPAHERLLGVVVRELGAQIRTRAAMTGVCAGAAGRMRQLTTGTLADVREMEQRHGGDIRVLGDLLHLEHRTAQTGRLADSLAVLTGADAGRRWTEPVAMAGVLRGALSRIGGYQRVRLHTYPAHSAHPATSARTAAVAGHAVEAVMHALSELVDNACRFSPPTEDVHVHVRDTRSGVVVTIEDAGVMMPEATRVRAEKLVSGDPLNPRALAGARLGLAVVGCLARAHGLLVSFRPSSRGGTGVVVLIPPAIVTSAAEVRPATPVTSHRPMDPPRPCTVSERYDRPPVVPPGGRSPAPAGLSVPLPKRPRGQTLGAARHGDLTPDPTASWLEPAPDHQPRPGAAAGGRPATP